MCALYGWPLKGLPGTWTKKKKPHKKPTQYIKKVPKRRSKNLKFLEIPCWWSFQFDRTLGSRGANVNGERGHKLIEYFRALSMPFIVWVSPGWVSFAAVCPEKDEMPLPHSEISAGSWFYLFIYSPPPSFYYFWPALVPFHVVSCCR